ncbi:hypothetical protein DN069_01390 [Streptacidiphilus pinicola]|uniref:Secreted protein n=1 Tax=Streptacidiphilus pinicola TaxID=2219663 RepID=A0A2X0IVE1_9ACTN|nr:DUF5719 family protein [Streptacidiphilus pinicola]RAG87513.1 hypothetical protein DN069_01390 [Streptacidiphilus pinicola]
MINRTTQSLLGALGVLALALGIAEAQPPKGQAAATGDSVRTAVQQTSLVCPPPVQGSSGSTQYSLAVPGGTGGSSATGSGSGAAGAKLTPLADPINGSATSGSGSSAAPSPSASGSASASASASPHSSASAHSSSSAQASPSTAAGGPGAGPSASPIAQQSQPGGTTTAKGPSGSNAPGMAATAGGALAPGFAVQQTTLTGVGLSGTGCTQAGTDFWFAGADTNKGTSAYLELSNAQDANADADIQIYGTNGEIDDTSAASINIPAHGTSQLLLSSLVQPGNDGQNLAIHVLVRSGQIAAALHETQDNTGADWIPSTALSPTAVIPGLPGDASKYGLTLAVPGDVDADLKVQLSSQGGWITPAGHETIHIKAGMVDYVDLGNVTRGQPGTLRLTPTDPKVATPFVATVQASGDNDIAYVTGTSPVTRRGTVAGNPSGASILLTAPSGAATVTVSSLGGNGGSPTDKTVHITAGSTVAIQPQAPSGASTFAVTITPTSGGPVYAARELGDKRGLTIQQIADDGSTVLIPTVIQNPAILVQ